MASVTLNLDLKMGSNSAFKDAVVSLTKEMQAQQQSAVKLQAALDPAFIKDRVRLTNEVAEAQASLNAALEKEQSLQGAVAVKGKTDADRRLAGLKSVNDALEQQRQHLASLAALSEPKAVRQRVGLQLQTEEATKNLTFTENKERARQLGPMKAVGDLFNFPDLSKMLAGTGGKIAGIGEALTARYGAPAAKGLAGASGAGGALGGIGRSLANVAGAGAGSGAAGGAGGLLSKAAGAGAGGAGGLLPKLAGGAGGLLSGIGGSLASAAAGPVGMALGAATALAPVVKSLASAPFGAVTAGMASVNKALAGMTGPLGAVGSALGVVEGIGSGMKSVGDKLGPLGIGLSVVGGAIEGVTQQVTAFLNTAVQLAQKANPATVQRLGFAIDDAAAVIGHRMLPVVELLTNAVRGIGDVLNTILPSTSQFRSALAPIGDVIEDIKEDVAPFANMMRGELADSIRQVGVAIRFLWDTTRPFIELVKWTTPFLSGPDDNLDSSQGAAARGAKFQDYSSYAHAAYASALSSGGIDPSRQVAKNTEAIPQILDLLRNRLKESPDQGVPADLAWSILDPFNMWHGR